MKTILRFIAILMVFAVTVRAQTPTPSTAIVPTNGSAQTTADDKLGFQLAIHSYTFRKFSGKRLRSESST
jgi:hypothetical protein